MRNKPSKQGQHWLQREQRSTGRMMEIRIMPNDQQEPADEMFVLGQKALKARQDAVKGLQQLAQLEAELARLKARK